MNARNKSEGSFSILEAIETLSTIVDADEDTDGRIEEKNSSEMDSKKRQVEWLEVGDPQDAMGKVKEIFHVILNYLKDYYQKKYSHISDQKTVEGIKAIMLLVGEAAKTLDKHKAPMPSHWKGSITQWKEYRQLQDFYRKKIDRNIDERILSKWLLGLTGFSLLKQNPERVIERKVISTKHLFVDLDTIRKDSEYELMLMTKEDGTRFFNPRLLRNIKLVCDFGGSLQETITDPLSQVDLWEDRICHTACRSILKSISMNLDKYYREVSHLCKDMDVVCEMNKAFMALMLGANEKNLLHNNPVKSCSDYFHDFQSYFRHALSTREYHKFLAYPPKKNEKAALSLLDIIQAVCKSLFSELRGLNELQVVFDQLLEVAHQNQPLNEEDKSKIWARLASDFSAIAQLLKNHPHGPLLKVLQHLEKEHFRGFDSLVQNNLPHPWFQLVMPDKKIKLLRLPSPTHQVGINKAVVSDEFKGFLYACNSQRFNCKHLVINLQDRTSWREHSRCQAIEQLQNVNVFSDNFHCVTFATDTEFYHQLPPYDGEDDSFTFMDQLREQVQDSSSGFYFDKKIQDALNDKFLEKMLESIHRVFFRMEPNLNRQERLDFITIFYGLLELKIIDIVQPDSFSLTCKDSIDVGGASAAFLLFLNKITTQENFSEKDFDSLNLILFGPAILIRERIMLPDVYNRFLSALKIVEECRNKLGFEEFQKTFFSAFDQFYQTPILKAKCITGISQQ